MVVKKKKEKKASLGSYADAFFLLLSTGITAKDAGADNIVLSQNRHNLPLQALQGSVHDMYY